MSRTIVRWLAFLGAAAAVVVTVYVVFDALVEVDHVAMPAAPSMPEAGEAGAVIVDVTTEPATTPQRPAPRKPKPATKPARNRLPAAPSQSFDTPSAPHVLPAPVTTPARRPRATEERRPAQPAPVVIDAPLDLYRALAETRAKKAKHEPDAGLPPETSRPPAESAPKDKAKRQPDAGVPAETAPPEKTQPATPTAPPKTLQR
jgi:hypothetical protein